MALLTRLLFVVLCAQLAQLTDPGCVIDLECEECIPENMPAVTSHSAANGSVRLAAGEEVALECEGGRFQAFPLQALRAACEAGRYRPRDQPGQPLHLLDLGCQENIFEDVLHQVSGCPPPLQARVYRRGARHLAALCFDPERGLARHLHCTSAPHNELPLPPHRDDHAPLSLFGNFNHMFDVKTRHEAERLYSDEERLNRRLHELFRPDGLSFAGQRLTSAKLLSGQYFEPQNARVTDFVSNRVAVWASVARGNLAHAQRDVARVLRRAELQLYCGTHGELALRTPRGRAPLRLRAGRFPAPRYIWTVLHAPRLRRALAVVVLNDPFVALSEVAEAAVCASQCSRVPWLRELRRLRRAEVPLYGLAWCCELPAAAARLPGLPPLNVSAGQDGLLTDLDD